ncbi:HD-GYP domain-containing protein [Bacillus songklensis]|uniref:HD-GYP domain-containing protein n=1 Tax=Bacillus songklensis TaxID=1069116 RepID=A0ABV8B9T8_9BACI
MRRTHISQVHPGDVLGSDIYGVKGTRLLRRGVKLTSSYISLLRIKGVQYVYIDDRHTHDIEATSLISPTVRQMAVKKVYETMTGLIDKKLFLTKISSRDLGLEYQNIFKEMLDCLLTQDSLLIHLSDLFLSKGYLFHHSVNVATIAGVIGIAKGYSTEKLLDLGVGALLFDIGMTQIPAEPWRKRGNLTEAERAIMEEHCFKGFQLLRRQRNISLFSAHCALQHHERYDGSGYPRRLKKDRIHEFARIVGLADVYDALISSRNHRKRYSPQEAAEYLAASGDLLFDYDIIKLFLKYVAVYPVASTVLLNTGETAVISNVFSDFPLHPVVRVIKNPRGEELQRPYEMDLRTQMSTTIVKVLP